ncbi:MAG: GntR family transcriptional regulator [Spirochaetales bacterium]|uniref:GntR family transcriptional regulator n=1 Tax=Candidatus Thalassospirochaeta sargassi TaxID=3119039 RepID=A0AAJ1IFI2_9SPIO|nr:GntR family transcriptional regulator [Spirochaetales bacterium]
MAKRVPAYYKVYSLLKDKILNGEFHVGDILPPEYELERIFNVSRITIRRAVEMLSEEGLLYVKQGKGTEVLDFKTTQNLNYITSFTETLKKQGYDVTIGSVHVEEIVPASRILEKLSLRKDSTVLHIQRIHKANGVPIAIVENYLVTEHFPGLAGRIKNLTSLYSFLERNYNIEISSAVEDITAKTAGVIESKLLDIAPGTPLLLVKRVTYSKGMPFDYAALRIIADRYKYSMAMRNRPPTI